MSILLTIILIAAIIAVALVWFTARTAHRVEAALPPRGQFMEIDGQRIHYVDTGATSGPVLVMIHGLGGNMLNFSDELVQRLSGEFRIILVDRPGSGYSTRPWKASAALSVQAGTIAKLIRALNLKKPLVVGHSLGGAVSLALALDHPDCVGALALLAPLTHPRKEVPEPFQSLVIESRILRAIVAWTVATPLSILRGEKVMNFVFAPDKVPADFGTRGGGLMSLRPSSFYGASTDLLAINDELPEMTLRYHSLNVPFGMLFGTGDHMLDHRIDGDMMKAKVPALDLALTEGGHMLLVCHADQSADTIRRVAQRMSMAAVA
jgi:pimeloyl-ACP methyl ester carboxylesterase